MKVITLNQNSFLSKCVELGKLVNSRPDFVLGILNGGGYVADEIGEIKGFKNIPIEYTRLQRKGELKKQNQIFSMVLKILPYSVLDKLRIYESNKERRSINALHLNELSNQKIDLNLSTSLGKPVQNILIVDDAIDTGKTMYVVKNNLMRLYPDAKIEVAVISWTIENSIIAPDYYLVKNNLVRFPWSKDYKGKDFEKKSFSS